MNKRVLSVIHFFLTICVESKNRRSLFAKQRSLTFWQPDGVPENTANLLRKIMESGDIL
jgi:hypothetical protein